MMDTQSLVALTEQTTGLIVLFVENTPISAEWSQDEHHILVPEGDWEGLLHEFLHWVVATDWERGWDNVALNADDVVDALAQAPDDHPEAGQYSQDVPEFRERQVCLIERDLERLLGLTFIHMGSCVYYDQDPTDSDRDYAYTRLNAAGITLADLAATYP